MILPNSCQGRERLLVLVRGREEAAAGRGQAQEGRQGLHITQEASRRRAISEVGGLQMIRIAFCPAISAEC